MRVLSWNLFHGRARPGSRRDLQDEFAACLAHWEWDVAVLQEVPPWWPAALARACDAQERHVLTSRNALLGLRRQVATRWPDLAGAQGGGANAILVRGGEILDHRHIVLRRRPERRVAHGVHLGDGLWVANLHAQAHVAARARADVAMAADALRGWAGAASCVLAGDVNLRAPDADGFAVLGVHSVDAVLGRGVGGAGPMDVLDAGALSDHKPIAVTLDVGRRQGVSGVTAVRL